MAKFSQKLKGKEVGAASVYAGRAFAGMDAAQKKLETDGDNYINEMNIGAGNVNKGNYKEAKTSGVKIRGTGAATKGVMARGPMG